MEIGSEFSLNKIPKEDCSKREPNWLKKYGNTILTTSGRGAINLLLQQVTPKNKAVLLPAYICESVILPFIDKGYKCYFYEVDYKLSPIIESIEKYNNIGIFLHMGYYGFKTNANLIKTINKFKLESTIIIEDVTHSLFSDFHRFKENDYYMGSIRKWFGVPSGGFLASSTRTLKRPLSIDINFPILRKEALINKAIYMKKKDNKLKKVYLKEFSEAENILDEDINPYRIDSLSLKLINSLNVDELISKRRENYKTLLRGLKDVSYLEVPFKNLTKFDCPIFFPIIIPKNRNEIRKKLIDEEIYCPVHWPIPDKIKENTLYDSLNIYNSILSIPCDQRYGIADMERIILKLKSL